MAELTQVQGHSPVDLPWVCNINLGCSSLPTFSSTGYPDNNAAADAVESSEFSSCNGHHHNKENSGVSLTAEEVPVAREEVPTALTWHLIPNTRLASGV